MRGIVFSQFIEFVESVAGEDMVDDMFDACDLPSGGSYTSVGNYDHNEILTMVGFLHNATGNNVAEMVTAFGRHLFGQLADSHKAIFADQNGLLDFLEGIESHIHTEVRKLYPDAELPMFYTDRVADNHLIMDYESSRPFADLAYGMMLGASDHFVAPLDISRKDIKGEGDGINRTRFEVKVG